MSKLKAIDYSRMDLYGILKINPYSKDKEVRRAYRKQALKLHPDKNPNNPNSAKSFLELQKAFELLTDPIEKTEYDRLLRAKEAAEEKRREQDKETRAFREKLERREAELKRQREERDELERVERLRRQAEAEEEERESVLEEKRREIEERRMRKEAQERAGEFNVKVKWEKDHELDASALKNMFAKYGGLEAVAVGRKRTAMLQFNNRISAMKSVQAEGNAWFVIEPMFETIQQDSKDENGEDDDFDACERRFLEALQHKQPSTDESPKERQQHQVQQSQHQKTNRDFEPLHERSLRQMEERKRLIEEMIKNDE